VRCDCLAVARRINVRCDCPVITQCNKGCDPLLFHCDIGAGEPRRVVTARTRCKYIHVSSGRDVLSLTVLAITTHPSSGPAERVALTMYGAIMFRANGISQRAHGQGETGYRSRGWPGPCAARSLSGTNKLSKHNIASSTHGQRYTPPNIRKC